MLQLQLASVGAGKTEAAIAALTETLNRKRFARVWVLLATRRQEDAFRQRLIELQDGRNLYFNVEFFNFYTLYRRLLNMAHQPARGLIDSARYGLLRTLIDELDAAGKLTLYHPIAKMPGFVRIVADLIYELKQNRVYPDEFLQAAATQKDFELGEIYANYQRILQEYDLVDKEGEGWLALTQLESHQTLARDVDLLIVDGYDQFTPVQTSLLRLLTERAALTLVTLTTVPGRTDTIGWRFQKALEKLHQLTPDFSETHLMARVVRHADLQHLAENVFLPKAKVRTPEGGISLIEAPDANGEIAAVLRRVKKLLVDEACAPDDILIALREWARYQPHFVALGREYQLPLALHYGEKLSDNPVIATLLKLLSLHEYHFRQRDLLSVLRSPYIQAPGLSAELTAKLDNLSQLFVVTGGRDLWLETIQQAALPILNEDGDEQAAILDETTAQRLEWDLSEFFDHISPPEQATVEYYVGWLDDLIGVDPLDLPDDDSVYLEPPYNLNVIAAVRQGDDATIARDLAALQEFKRVLRGLLSTYELLGSFNGAYKLPMSWDVFFIELTTAILNAQVNPQPNRGGQVLVTTAADARGLPHKHVFILGLSEGIFPAPIPEDPLYLDSEREQLTQRGVLLETRLQRATDDGVFYELISLPRESLTLTRPTAQDGQPWTESHLWRAVRQIFDLKPERIRAGEVVAAHEAASLSEVALAVAGKFGEADVVGVYNWLLYAQGDFWSRIRVSRDSEVHRLSEAPHDHYSGRLHNPALIEQVAQSVENRYWSATRLNEYGTCPFRYFSKYLLSLEETKPPEEGMDARQLGSVYHKILERTYLLYQAEKLPIAPQYTTKILEILHDVARTQLDHAPQDFGFRATALWNQEKTLLLKRLQRLVTLDFAADNPIQAKFPGETRMPYKLESPFGLKQQPPLTVNLGDAGVLKFSGVIDRIDKIGDSLVVIDYKSRSSAYKLDDMREGRNFQMVIYILAARELIASETRLNRQLHVAGGLFWSVRTGEISGVLDDGQESRDVIASAQDYLADYIGRIRRGEFIIQPSKVDQGRCASYCEYHELCRLCGLNLAKA